MVANILLNFVKFVNVASFRMPTACRGWQIENYNSKKLRLLQNRRLAFGKVLLE